MVPNKKGLRRAPGSKPTGVFHRLQRAGMKKGIEHTKETKSMPKELHEKVFVFDSQEKTPQCGVLL